jgi:hypothetical protein
VQLPPRPPQVQLPPLLLPPRPSLSATLVRAREDAQREFNQALGRLKRTLLWRKLGERGLALFMESPKFIRVGTEQPGEPVYYVNGMLTSRSEAVKEAKELSTHLGRPVNLILNDSFMNGSTGTPTCVDDVSEAVYDREWPAQFATMNPMSLLPLLGSQVNPPFAQLNPATRQLTHLVYHADRPISVVTHSQGCLQMRNALLVAGTLGKETTVRQRVAWVATGSPVNPNEVWPAPARCKYLVNSTDPVAVLIGFCGGRGTGTAVRFADPKHNVTKYYIPKIHPSMLWP